MVLVNMFLMKSEKYYFKYRKDIVTTHTTLCYLYITDKFYIKYIDIHFGKDPIIKKTSPYVNRMSEYYSKRLKKCLGVLNF